MLENADKRRRYLKRWHHLHQQQATFVYLDESGFSPTAERTHGYALKGTGVYGLRSGHRRPRTSLIAARIGKTFAPPMLFDGTCNTRIFNAWLEQMLCPLLQPGMVVIMDNATFHKSTTTRKLIRKTGAELLFLPPYSPDLNPIEQTFATLKRARQTYPQLNLDAIVASYAN